MSKKKDNEFNFADISDNPYIPKPDDYFEGYNKSIEENFNTDSLKYTQLTHNLFTTTHGKDWLAQTKMLMTQTFVDLASSNAELQMASLQGSRALLSTIEQHITAFEKHLQGK